MVVTDNATSFTSAEFQCFVRENDIHHKTIEPRHSQGNGLAERAVRDVKLALQRSDGDWDAALSRWLLRQHITPHSTTSVTPSELMIGRVIRSRLDLLHPDMRNAVVKQQVTQKENHDQKVRSVRMFEVADLVFARNYGVGAQWVAGTVVGVDGPVSYAVRLEDGRIWRRHTDQMRRRLSCELFPGDPALNGDSTEAATEGTAPSTTAPTELLRPPPGPLELPVCVPEAAPAKSLFPEPHAPAPVEPRSGKPRDARAESALRGACADASSTLSAGAESTVGGPSASASLSESVPIGGGASDTGVRRSGRRRKQTEFFGT